MKRSRRSRAPRLTLAVLAHAVSAREERIEDAEADDRRRWALGWEGHIILTQDEAAACFAILMTFVH